MGYNSRLLSINYGLLGGIVALFVGLLDFPGTLLNSAKNISKNTQLLKGTQGIWTRQDHRTIHSRQITGFLLIPNPELRPDFSN